MIGSQRRHVWLRDQVLYRMYVCGLRFFVAGTVGIIVIGNLGGGVLPVGVVEFVAICIVFSSIVSLLVGVIGWLKVPDKIEVNQHQMAFISMIGRGILFGIPSARVSPCRLWQAARSGLKIGGGRPADVVASLVRTRSWVRKMVGDTDRGDIRTVQIGIDMYEQHPRALTQRALDQEIRSEMAGLAVATDYHVKEVGSW